MLGRLAEETKAIDKNGYMEHKHEVLVVALLRPSDMGGVFNKSRAYVAGVNVISRPDDVDKKKATVSSSPEDSPPEGARLMEDWICSTQAKFLIPPPPNYW